MSEREIPLRFRWLDAVRDSGLPTTAKAILFVYGTFMDNDTGVCWPSQNRVAKGASCARSTVQRWRDALLDVWLEEIEVGVGRAKGHRALIPNLTDLTSQVAPATHLTDTSVTPDSSGESLTLSQPEPPLSTSTSAAGSTRDAARAKDEVVGDDDPPEVVNLVTAAQVEALTPAGDGGDGSDVVGDPVGDVVDAKVAFEQAKADWERILEARSRAVEGRP